ncbi:transient receptor potential cation channel subfamily V member 5-like [Saccostrea echinata]|uniref:transient receptor potential cation channel subfamily V member 5-like n=1 Tax=Saccostrea echinata TaxID=191078 RepID=UPI002A82A8C4|nr:transient receptor potential cation channel subfamily V member 5-like [Saccostrea echinata]
MGSRSTKSQKQENETKSKDEEEKQNYLVELAESIKNDKVNDLSETLKALQDTNIQQWLKNAVPNSGGDSLLHIAVKYHDTLHFVELLGKYCPGLLVKPKENPEFYGQIPLHIAIAKGNLSVIELMLKQAQKNTNKKNSFLQGLLHKQASGSRFVNTIMMGQLPLTVAALKGDPEVIDLLIEYGANIVQQNSLCDTVFHSIVKYAAIYPDKINYLKEMLLNLNDRIENMGEDNQHEENGNSKYYRYKMSYVWFLRNNDNMTPLQLAAKYGVTELFQLILNLENVYCFTNSNDGLFEIKEYDISEIDTVCNIRMTFESKRSLNIKGNTSTYGVNKTAPTTSDAEIETCLSRNCPKQETESVLEMLFHYNYDGRDAYNMIELPPVKRIVIKKWKNYFWSFMTMMMFHFVFMIVLTIYTVESSTISQDSTANFTDMNYTSNQFILVFRWMSLIIGVLYTFIAVCVIITKLRRNNALYYALHNLEYILPLLFCGISLVIDSIMDSVSEQQNENIPLIIALVFGWWVNVFFLSPFKYFSFFTEMIKRVLIGDFIRFGLIILFELFAFTAGMYSVFQGVEVEGEIFRSFERTLLTLFKLGIGIEDIDVLYEARIPWLAISIYALFISFTYLLMLNALIAMMSETCSNILKEQYPQWRIQQLSVVLFLEDILCLCWFETILSEIGNKKDMELFLPNNHYGKHARYFMEIHSLQSEYATAEDKEQIMKKNLNLLQAICTSPETDELTNMDESIDNMEENNKKSRDFRRNLTQRRKSSKRYFPLSTVPSKSRRKEASSIENQHRSPTNVVSTDNDIQPAPDNSDSLL